jgi:hypothetical protein
MKDQMIKINLMKHQNKKSDKQIIEHVFLKIYLSCLIILILFVPFVNIINNYNSQQFNNPLYAIECQENLKTSDPGPLLSFYSFQFDDDTSGSSIGDNDGNIDAGETIELRLTLENTGDEDALNVNATLSSLNNNITITNGFQDFIAIPQGSTGISSSFYVFKINSSCQSDYYITIDITMEASNGGPWNYNFQIHIIGRGNPVYYSYSIYSEADGDLPADHDDIIDAGEVIVFDTIAKNLGGANLYGIIGIIAENDPYTTINDNSGNFGTINSNGGTNTGRFGITVSGSCPDKHQIDFNLNLTDNEGTLWEITLYLIVNGTSDYEVYNFYVIEDSGDGDNFVDAGEYWYASITIKNIGEANGHSVLVYLDSSDPYVTFDTSSRSISFSTTDVNTTKSYSDSYYWGFRIADTTPSSHVITFSIRITDNSGYQQTFTKTVTVIEGIIPSDGNGDEFPPIDWSLFGLIFLSIVGITSCIGLIYANHHFHWLENYSKSHKRKKQIKLKEKELEDNKFENLIRKSKDLVDKSQHDYSKESFLTAVKNWEDAINYYLLALKKAPSSGEKIKIKDNIRILRENICNAYVENGKKHNLAAKNAHKGENIQKAQKEWNSAKNDFQMAIDLIKSEKLEISYEQIAFIIKSIELNLTQLEIEKSCLDADSKLEKARSFQNTDLKEATLLSQNSFLQYSEAKTQAEKYPEFQELIVRIQTKMQNARIFQSELQDKMDELIGITPLTTKVIIDDIGETGNDKVGTIIKAEKREKALSIIREYEFIGGQIRFKIALINNTRNPLTNFKISFDIPDALKWIMHEPNYERKGDSLLMSKVGINEKKTVSLYLEPINCVESHINATVSFFDAKDRPQAVPMEPKMISITCPIFFTESEANLARIKSLQRKLNHRDRKIFPIINSEKVPLIYSSVLSVFGNYDIKLVFKEFSEKDKFGEAWFYGITKVKKNRLVMYILLDGENKTLELEVSGDSEEQITAFLAEIGNQIRQQLIKHNVITSDDKFYDIRISVLLNECPYCGGRVSPEDVQNYHDGESIKCKYCDQLIINVK